MLLLVLFRLQTLLNVLKRFTFVEKLENCLSGKLVKWGGKLSAEETYEVADKELVLLDIGGHFLEYKSKFV